MANRVGPMVDWLQIESSAPGKIIISGEYSVVHDRHAVAAAIDLRTTVRIRPRKETVRLHLKNLGVTKEWPVLSFSAIKLVHKYTDCLCYNDSMASQIDHLLHPRFCVKTEEFESLSATDDKLREKRINDSTVAFLLLYIGLSDSFWKSFRSSIEVEVESNVPVGSGLGSSSAYSVALCGALMKVFRVSAEKYIISNWALNIDKFFHGRPSGIDNNVVTMGGYLLFQSGKIKETEVMHKNTVRVLLIDTNVSRSTRFLCESVEKQLREEPEKINSIFDSINMITTQIWRNLRHPDFDPNSIAQMVEENQNLLEELGVGHERLTDICNKARSSGLRAKMTGAGGGGIAFVLFTPTDNCDSVEHLKRELANSPYTINEHVIGCEGLKVKVTLDPDFK